MTIIGVLALQGAFTKHIAMLESIGVHALDVRKPQELEACEGLIIPGGESTTIMRQVDFIHFAEPLKEFAKHKPIFGTCAGLIIMSQKIVSDPFEPFGILNVEVERNAFGRQYESFSVNLSTKISSTKEEFIPAVFIRAPRIRHCGLGVEVLATFENEPVLVKQNFHLGATFHPELSHSSAIHQYFTQLVEKNQQVRK